MVMPIPVAGSQVVVTDPCLPCRNSPCQWHGHSADLPDRHQRQRPGAAAQGGADLREAQPERHQHHGRGRRHRPQRGALRLRAAQRALCSEEELDHHTPQW